MVEPTTFVEDSLRALRAVQFASRFDFDVSPTTQFVISQMDLRDLPRERVWMEMEKWLMQSRKPSRGLFFMKHSGILEKLFPELDVLDSVPQDERWHPEGDVLRHTALALDVAKDNLEGLTYPEQVTVMLATLCHDLGKAETTEVLWEHTTSYSCADWCNGDGTLRTEHRCVDDVEGVPKVTAHGHAEAGVSLARNMLDRFGLHSIEGYDVRAQVLALVENHLAPFEFFRKPPKDAAFRRLATRVDLKLLHKVAHADAHSRNGNFVGRVFGTEAQDWFLEKINTLSIPPKGPEKLLLGRHLLEMGVKPGKFMGEVVNAVFEMQLDGKVTTLDEAKAVAQELLENGREAFGASS